MVLPSFLEYSDFQLQKKLQNIVTNIETFQKISGQNCEQNKQKVTQISHDCKKQELEVLGENYHILHFHLDFVLVEFAKSRQVMQSLEQNTVFNLLLEFFEKWNLRLSVHLMGENLDWEKAFKFWQGFIIPPNWQIELFVEEKMTDLFSLNYPNLTTFCWFDKNFWQNEHAFNIYEYEVFQNSVNKINKTNLDNNVQIEKQFLEQNVKNSLYNSQTKRKLQTNKKKKILLMTVCAGLSGQKLEKETQKLVLEIVQKNLDVQFILDGGWQVEDLQIIKKLNLKNVDLVSYSSFWQKFEQEIT